MDTETRSSAPDRALAPLLAGLVDYAGTFPPAGLALDDAAAEFLRHLAGPHRRLLARFAVALADLAPLARLVAARPGAAPVAVAAVVGTDWAGGAAALSAHAPVLDVLALEGRVASSAEAAAARAAVGSGALGPELVGEVAAEDHERWPAVLDALVAHGLRAKLRTGAVVPSGIPRPALVARFLVACAARGLPCKLTAGLHRAHSCVRALTYANDAPQGPMYGFLNAYAAAALAYLRRADEATVAACVADEARGAVAVDARGLAWRDHLFGPAELALLRR